MKIYIVTYELNANRDYQPLFEAINSYPGYVHIMPGMAAIAAESLARLICQHLQSCIVAGDQLCVIKASGAAAWFGLSAGPHHWLKHSLEHRDRR